MTWESQEERDALADDRDRELWITLPRPCGAAESGDGGTGDDMSDDGFNETCGECDNFVQCGPKGIGIDSLADPGCFARASKQEVRRKMSDGIKRYGCGSVYEWPGLGQYVAYTDHQQALAARDETIKELQKSLNGEREALLKYFLELRGVETPCKKCGGTGVITYGSTSTWRGGIGGQSMTNDVCDTCWGSGDAVRTWVNLRKASSEKKAREEMILKQAKQIADSTAQCNTLRSSVDELARANQTLITQIREQARRIAALDFIVRKVFDGGHSAYCVEAETLGECVCAWKMSHMYVKYGELPDVPPAPAQPQEAPESKEQRHD